MSHSKQCASVHDVGHGDLAPVLDVVGAWAVTHYGVEHLDLPKFRVPISRLMEDWTAMPAGQSWVDGSSFIGALRAGRLLHGLTDQEAEDHVPQHVQELLGDLSALFDSKR